MMTKRWMLFLMVMAGALLAGGCVSRVGTFSVLSTAPPQYNLMQTAEFRRGVESVDARWWFLFIPLGPKPTIGGAVNDALREGNGDFIERAEIYESGWTLLIFSRGSFRVRGDVGDSSKGRGR